MRAFDDIDRLLSPFWRGRAVFRESILFLDDERGAPVPSGLLYPATSICDVRSASLETAYELGADVRWERGALCRVPGGRAPHLSPAELYPAQPLPGRSFPRIGGGNLLFGEGAAFHDLQLVVTYEHASDWTGPVPRDQGGNVSRFAERLRDAAREPSILYMGDSITVGLNSSGPIGAPPHLGSWCELVTAYLERVAGRSIAHHNLSQSGQVSAWGVEHAPEAGVVPDLLVLAFGMNDGSQGVPPDVFQRNLSATMDFFRARNPALDVVLVGSILPNPEARGFAGSQRENRDRLWQLAGPGVAVADVTRMHEAFLRRKSYVSMTGNHINHPNDFTARLQAMVVLQALGAYGM